MVEAEVLAPSRREVLAAGAGLLLGAGSVFAAPVPAGKPLRVAHLTDMHVKPERGADEGYAMALESLKKLDPQPDMLVTGGDHVMDTLFATRQRAQVQWDLYQKVLEQNSKLRVYPVIGNHDVWGWSAQEPVIDPASEGYGKAMYLDRMGLRRSYYSFDAGGWHFIVLDNIGKRDNEFFSLMDDEQIEWLRGDLASNGSRKPVCVFSHVPFLCVCVLFFREKPARFWEAPDYLIYHDVKPLLPLFQQGGVKLLVSGHIHLVDRVDYKGMTFVCDGAVSGNWWGGPFQEFPEGYGVFDFWPDGSFTHQYVAYGWKARKDAP